jgi:cytochrome c oxidase cbb3-type subunit 4
MKFIHYLETITGIGIYPFSSLLIFFLFFAATTTWVLKADKRYITSMKHLPFGENEIDN